MAAVLASQSSYRHNIELSEQARQTDDLSFSQSISKLRLSRESIHSCRSSGIRTVLHLRAQEKQIEPENFVTNGRASKLISTKELTKNKDYSSQNRAQVNGASLVKRKSNGSLLKVQNTESLKELPFTEELRVLPSDETFSWATENYNSWQRSIDVWSFVLSLRLRILFDNAKWAYPTGFTEEKQV